MSPHRLAYGMLICGLFFLFSSECGTQLEEKVLAFYFSFDTFWFFIDRM